MKEIKRILLVVLILSLTSCISEKDLYTINIKLIDGSWKQINVKLDRGSDLRIGCSSYDCGTTSLIGFINHASDQISQPNVIDFKIVKIEPIN